MKQRAIDKELIEECLKNPDKTLLKEGTYRCVKKIDKALVVIYRINNDAILVITAFMSTKTHKYLG